MKNFHWYFFILFYSIFFIWYSNLSGPLNDEEIDSFMKVISERSANDEQSIQRLRKFMEEDEIQYINRLSDLLFVIARKLNILDNNEILWKPLKNK